MRRGVWPGGRGPVQLRSLPGAPHTSNQGSSIPSGASGQAFLARRAPWGALGFLCFRFPSWGP